MSLRNILLYDNGQPFDLETIYTEPLGGSETSFMLLAKGLSEITDLNQCVLLTSKKSNKIVTNKLIIDNSDFFDGYAQNADIIILNRHIPQNIELFYGKKYIYYYAHDAYDQEIVQWMMIKNNHKFFHNIFCVSEWQKQTFIKYFDIDPNKLIVIGNSIDYAMTYGFTQRNEYKFIFAGIPYKGIEILNTLFNDICITSKRDDLFLHIFSNMSLYGQKNDDYDEFFSDLSRNNNVFIHNPVSMKELIYELKTSSFYLSPNLYHETFGINLVLAQACGCLPIATNNGASNEVIQHDKTGIVINYPNIENYTAYKYFIEKSVELINYNQNELYKMRLNGIEETKKWDYLNISKKVNDIISEV